MLMSQTYIAPVYCHLGDPQTMGNTLKTHDTKCTLYGSIEIVGPNTTEKRGSLETSPGSKLPRKCNSHTYMLLIRECNGLLHWASRPRLRFSLTLILHPPTRYRCLPRSSLGSVRSHCPPLPEQTWAQIKIITQIQPGSKLSPHLAYSLKFEFPVSNSNY